jgi:hypothetical protein
MTIKWRRSWFPVYYAFCPTEADFRVALSGAVYDKDCAYPDTAGCCVSYDDEDGDRRVLVTLDVDWEGEPQVAMGVLVHEVVHVVQWIVTTMEDKTPSEEFQAYATQGIFVELLGDIAEWRNNNLSVGALPAR